MLFRFTNKELFTHPSLAGKREKHGTVGAAC